MPARFRAPRFFSLWASALWRKRPCRPLQARLHGRQRRFLRTSDYKQNVPDRIGLVLSRTVILKYFRGATLIHGNPRALCEILSYLRQLTYALTSQNTQTKKSFDCALRGPFGRLHLRPALTSPDSLCAHDCFDLRFNSLKCYRVIKFF